MENPCACNVVVVGDQCKKIVRVRRAPILGAAETNRERRAKFQRVCPCACAAAWKAARRSAPILGAAATTIELAEKF